MSNVGRCLPVSEPGAEETQQLPIMVFQDNSCSLPRERYP
ncbi:sigma-70 factor, ECF subfamily [Pseudomonas paraeruginosa]|uniref:Sigma-70 factor, ECF subfamily n=1 Tax=Pseudomonas paraeruginosa TaxID=2994495 RepID=A0A2R3IRZ4_9PSED|nr:sigma-70 factor, ECF subfamily [Pseudomonas paraeruginosa]